MWQKRRARGRKKQEKLKPGASSHGAKQLRCKQYGDGRTDRPTDGRSLI